LYDIKKIVVWLLGRGCMTDTEIFYPVDIILKTNININATCNNYKDFTELQFI
jgi:hypothetical protein